MLCVGKALKVTIYLSDGATNHGVPVYSSVLDFLFYRGVCGATVLKGIAGFGADHHMHSASIVEISDHLPLKIEFIESQEKVDEILPKLEAMVGSGMIEIQETHVAKPAQASKPKKQQAPAHRKIEGKAKMMRIFIGESDKWRKKPLHRALVEAMRANDIAGVTVYRGLVGYGVWHGVDRDKAAPASQDCTMMLSAIDSEQTLQALLPMVEQMVGQGMVVLSDVDIIKYAYKPFEEPAKGSEGVSA